MPIAFRKRRRCDSSKNDDKLCTMYHTLILVESLCGYHLELGHSISARVLAYFTYLPSRYRSRTNPASISYYPLKMDISTPSSLGIETELDELMVLRTNFHGHKAPKSSVMPLLVIPYLV
jgi:hypothetical protein